MKFAYLIEPPFNYVDAAGRVTGCDVELARYIFSQLGIERFEPVEAEFAELLPGLANGRWRMTTGLFGTEERRALASFSRPIWALPDGLLVRRGNPLQLSGYASVARTNAARLAIIRDQFQHRSAIEFGVPDRRIEIFHTYREAARAAQDGRVDAYASVARAHTGFMEQHPDWKTELVVIPATEKPPAFGSFAFALDDIELRREVDEVLSGYLGSKEHRRMAACFGFSDTEVDLVVDADS